MKVIDLLNKIANNELEDTKFIYDGNYCIYHNHTIDVYTDKTYECYDFTYDEVNNFICIKGLNDEVEILDNNTFENLTKDSAKNIIQNMFEDLTPEQFEELKKQVLEKQKDTREGENYYCDIHLIEHQYIEKLYFHDLDDISDNEKILLVKINEIIDHINKEE